MHMQFNFDQYRSHRGGYGYLIRWAIYAIVLIGLILLIRHKLQQKEIISEPTQVDLAVEIEE
jgi:heme exporter protein D